MTTARPDGWGAGMAGGAEGAETPPRTRGGAVAARAARAVDPAGTTPTAAAGAHPRRGIRAAASARSDAEGRPPAGWRHHLWCFLRQGRATHALWLLLAALLGFMLARGDAHDAWIAGSALGLALLPAAFEGLVGIRLPRGFVLSCGLFTVMTVAMGELTDFYERFAWWDAAMHLLSGFVVAGIGLVAALTLLRHLGVARALWLPTWMALFVGCGIAAVWELFEFALDERWGFSTQHGLADTMHDIALGCLGSALCALAGAAHLAGLPTGPFGRAVDAATRENAPPMPADAS